MKDKTKMFKIVILSSGKSRGSNFQAIAEYISNNNLNIQISFLVITNPNAPIIKRAERLGIKYYLLNKKNLQKEHLSFEEKLEILLEQHKVNLIVLAGFMRKLSSDFVYKHKKRIINIHPALLPKYGGKGMYGMRVHKAVFDAKDDYSGVSVHYVNAEYDTGKIIKQEKVCIKGLNSPEEIAEKVLKIEHRLYPEVIAELAENIIHYQDGSW